MPSYDLSCPSCGAEFEVFRQGFLRDDDRVCPSCGAEAEQMVTQFVTSRPRRGAPQVDPGPSPVRAGGGGCGPSCGCGGH